MVVGLLRVAFWVGFDWLSVGCEQVCWLVFVLCLFELVVGIWCFLLLGLVYLLIVLMRFALVCLVTGCWCVCLLMVLLVDGLLVLRFGLGLLLISLLFGWWVCLLLVAWWFDY